MAVRALAFANARYWPTVAPVVGAELERWSARAELIDDLGLRRLATDKLREESFNAEVAATLATLAPRPARAATAQAIVCLELLFDYLDGRTEEPSTDPIGDGARLFGTFISALDLSDDARVADRLATASHTEADAAYAQALGARTRERLLELPSAGCVAGVARASAERCAQAQTLLHATATLGDQRLRDWASGQARGSGLEWREYVGGCASSVLAVHALIAAAADADTSTHDAQRLDAAYLAMGAVITMLDSLVDHNADAIHGQPGLLQLYDSREHFARQLIALTRETLVRAREAPHGDHHAMTLSGIVAYYTTHPGARHAHSRELVAAVRRELSPVIWPALAVMGTWRQAKLARGRFTRARPGLPIAETRLDDTPDTGTALEWGGGERP